jgi:8-oxo-dGTP diphosphatase
MGIEVEFNQDLALRSFDDYLAGRRRAEECIPQKLEKGKVYRFLKKGQRVYWFAGEIPLRLTTGSQNLSKPIASILIIEASHFIEQTEIWTHGLFQVMDIFDINDNKVYFDGFDRIKFENGEEKINSKQANQVISKKPGAGFGVMILKNEKLLLGKRNDNAEKASSELHGEGTWTMPGGKLHFLENFEDGAKREVLEETGIKLENAKVICVNNDTAKDAHFITIGLLAEAGKDFILDAEPIVMEPEEITEWKWFSLDNLPEKLFNPSKKVLENYKSGKFYIK